VGGQVGHSLQRNFEEFDSKQAQASKCVARVGSCETAGVLLAGWADDITAAVQISGYTMGQATDGSTAHPLQQQEQLASAITTLSTMMSVAVQAWHTCLARLCAADVNMPVARLASTHLV
jgi:hypothetical protein